MKNRCDTCLNSREIISENGYHSICGLPEKKAVNCVLGKKDMYRAKLIGAKLMKNNQLNVVRDDDLVGLLKSLNVYDSVINGEHKCLFCDNTITLDNLESIVPHEGTIQFTCDATDCHAKLIGWRN